MSERFTRLFSLPAELYTEGSPLLIEAGALLRDSQSNKLLAQLKLKNLDARALRAVQVRLWPEDAFGHATDSPVLYTYLDLNVPQGGTFGAKNPIPLPDPATRNLRAEICDVAFADGSRWTAPEGAVWAPLPAAEPVEKALSDAELCKQLRLEQGENCRFVPTRHGELWRCACGEAVKGETCPACGKGFFEIDLPALTEAKDKRLAEEKAVREKAAAEAAEQARIEAEKAEKLAKEKAERAGKAKAKRKKAGKILGITVPATLLVAAAILLGIPGLSAIQAKKAADAGDYIGAVEKYRSAAGWDLFENLFHPGDKAEALVPAARYQEGEAALVEGRYEDAFAAFEAAGHYEDAAERRSECLTGAFYAYLEAGELEKAEELLKEIPRGPEYDNLTLGLAQGYLDAGDYNKALICLPAAKCSDPADEEQRQEIRYKSAVGLYESGVYERAAMNLRRISNYSDANHYIQLCAIGMVEESVKKGDYSTASKHAKTVDISQLTAEEQARFSDSLYGWANTIENGAKTAEDYAAAFAMYQLFGKGDYQARMDACNSKYIETPRSIGHSYDGTPSSFKITNVLAQYHNGKVTFTVEYTADQDGTCYIWAFYTNGGGPRESTTFRAGEGSFSLTLNRSKELGTPSWGGTITEWNIYLTNDRSPEEIGSWNKFSQWSIGGRSFFDTISIDLYGNPIP